uniref:Uncharacterized protein n=1 Tax=Avena sativa TaxID=4498 RepID=A0ACD5YE18_AVESA
MGWKCWSSCHVKAIFGRMKIRCLEGKRPGYETKTVKAEEVRQDTLQDILSSPQSFEADETGAPSSRRQSPKVRPLNLDCSYENNSPDVSFSIDRMSMRSQNSIARRVSFRSPDERDIFIIPARKDPDGYSSTDDESPESASEEGIDARRSHCVITRY